ncbi:MAG: hypothetical protein IJ220_05360 [Clostridia bacterium]|nr:hypothetical protein [Clostridia bacterium]
MMIERCQYYDATEKMLWTIAVEDENVVMTKGKNEKKAVPKEYIKNLDIFFGTHTWEEWKVFSVKETSGDKNSITLIGEGNECILEELPMEEQKVFEDLYHYFEAYFEKEIKSITLSFHSFDGGGPEYWLEIEEKGIFTWYSQRHYYNADHENLCGAGYDVEFSLYPLRKGTATAILTGDSPICPEPVRKITVEVKDDFTMEHQVETLDIRRQG